MLRSAPAQNVLPRPRISTTRTSSSSSARSSAAPRLVSSAQLTQFLTSGRFSQIVATPSATSYWMTSSVVLVALVWSCTAMVSPLPPVAEFAELTSDHIMIGTLGKSHDRRFAISCRGDLVAAPGHLPYLKLVRELYTTRDPMNDIVQIPLPLPHIGSVNAWLLRGDPLTLVDTGPRSDEALTRSRPGCGTRASRLEDIELVLVTHHHLDHAGLAATITAALRRARSRRSSAPPPTASATTTAPRRTAASRAR